jgi:ATP-dependent helicase/nuclease subunit A
LLTARSHADWLTLWLSQLCPAVGTAAAEGEHDLFKWKVHGDHVPSALGSRVRKDAQTQGGEEDTTSAQGENIRAAEMQALLNRLSWTYPFGAATGQPAKTSVSALRRQHHDQLESEQQAALFSGEINPNPSRGSDFQPTRSSASSPSPPREERAGERRPFGNPKSQPTASPLATGAAHHRFLQFVSLAATANADTLRQEAGRLAKEGVLSDEEVGLLDSEALSAFWNSDLGSRIRAQSEFVHRELAFTARFEPGTLPGVESAAPNSQAGHAGLEGDFVVVQGVADLVVLRPDAIWLVDFKTDSVQGEELALRIKEYEVQVRLYADALARIYRRPVTECWLYFLSNRRAVRFDRSS